MKLDTNEVDLGRRKLFGVGVAAASAVVLTGCSAQAQGKAPASAPQPPPPASPAPAPLAPAAPGKHEARPLPFDQADELVGGARRVPGVREDRQVREQRPGRVERRNGDDQPLPTPVAGME